MVLRRTFAATLIGPLFGAAARAQVAVDPRSLIGQWDGDLLGIHPGKYYLSITGVDGNKLTGRARAVVGTARGEYNIAGTLQGDMFTFKSLTHDLTVELTVAGDTMTGHGERGKDGIVAKFVLKRVK